MSGIAGLIGFVRAVAGRRVVLLVLPGKNEPNAGRIRVQRIGVDVEGDILEISDRVRTVLPEMSEPGPMVTAPVSQI